MSQENLELLRAQYASFQTLGRGGDVRLHFLRFFASDAEYWPVEEIDSIRGHDALIQYTERWLDAWESTVTRWTRSSTAAIWSWER